MFLFVEDVAHSGRRSEVNTERNQLFLDGESL